MLTKVCEIFKKRIPTVREYVQALDEFKEFDKLLKHGDVNYKENKDRWAQRRQDAEDTIKLFHHQNGGA